MGRKTINSNKARRTRMTNVWIKADGTSQEVEPGNGKEFTNEEIHEYVGGYYETIPAFDGRLMLVNEMGKLECLPENEIATAMLHPDFRDNLVGDVLLIDRSAIS
jgi:hypothetical protein